MQGNVLDINAAAGYLNVSTSALRLWKRQNKGPQHFKLGKLLRYRQQDLDSFIQRKLVSTHDDAGEL